MYDDGLTDWRGPAADNKHFTLHVNGKEYPAKIGALFTAFHEAFVRVFFPV